MNSILLVNIIRWIANIFGGILLAFFCFMFIAHLFGESGQENSRGLTQRDIIMFVFLGCNLIGLFVAYFKRLLGALLAIIGAVGFIAVESVSEGRIWSPIEGLPFYLLLLAGLLHLLAWRLNKISSPVHVSE